MCVCARFAYVRIYLAAAAAADDVSCDLNDSTTPKLLAVSAVVD